MERRVGVADDGLGLGVSGRADGHADARSEHDFVATDHERRQQFAEHAIRDNSGIAHLGEAVEQDRELVPAEPRHQVVAAQVGHAVGGAQTGLQAPRGGRQDRVGCLLVRIVVVRPRPAQVDEEHREMVRGVPPRPLNRARQVVDEEEAVREASQRVGDFLGGHVGMAPHYPDGAPALVADDDAVAGCPAVGPIAVQQPVGEVELGGAALQVFVDLAPDLGDVVGMDAREPGFRRVPDEMLIAAHHGDPPGGEVDPIGGQVPVPESGVVAASSQVVRVHGLSSRGRTLGLLVG